MKKNENTQLSEIFILLANIKDYLRKQNELLTEISVKLGENRTEIPSTIKHLVVLKKSQESTKKAL